LITPIVLGEVQIAKLLFMSFFPFPRYFLLLDPDIFVSSLILNPLSETILMLSNDLDKVRSVQYRVIAVLELRNSGSSAVKLTEPHNSIMKKEAVISSETFVSTL